MAIVILQSDVLSDAGQAPTQNTPLNIANTYKFRNNGRTILHFKKTGLNACTASVNVQAAPRGHTIAAQTINVPATVGDVFIGPFPSDLYDDVNHDVSFTVSEVTGLTVEVLQLP